MGEWSTLLAVQAGAAATLTGLVFVAVSINLSKIMAVHGLSGRAAESIFQLLQVFFIATAGLIPHQSDWAFGVELLVISTALWMAQLTAQLRYLSKRAGHPWSWFVTRALATQLATIPFWVAGIELLVGMPGGTYWLVPGFVFSFAAGVLSAWVLLIEILR